jgi:hypothetical protein
METFFRFWTQYCSKRNNIFCSEETILPEYDITSSLHILRGERSKNKHHIVGTCPDAKYKAFSAFLDAVNSVPEFEMKLPKSPEHWDQSTNHTKTRAQQKLWLVVLVILMDCSKGVLDLQG